MKVGIIGFRGCGKTTVFNALTGLHAEVGGFHGDNVKNLGNIKVPDDRLQRLADKIKPKKLTFAEIFFADLAAASAKEEKGKGLPAQVLAEMRQSDALVHVVRGFESPELTEPADLLRDLQTFEAELSFSDLLSVENRLERLKKQGAKGQERDHLEAIQAHLEKELPLRTMDLPEEIWAQFAGFGFLSRKPCMALLNVPEESASAAVPSPAAAYCLERQIRTMVISAKVEMELNDLGSDERDEFLGVLGLTEPAKGRFIREVYDMLSLISFFTVGPDEVRAWTIRKGTRAQQAAGKIHSDIERGFIRAEVMAWEEVLSMGETKCRELGKLRLEGKDYIPKDGEIIHYRFNV